MDDLQSRYLLGFAAVLVTWLAVRLLRTGSRQAHLPPGPPTIPVLGNAHLFPTTKVYIQFTAWAKTYGDIYSLKVGNQTMVILTSARLVRDLLDQRTATTSDRPTLHIIDRITGGLNLPLMRYGQLWKEYRRALRDLLSREACISHLPIQHAEAAQLMYDLLKQPEDFFVHVHRYSFSTILSAAFGFRCPRYADSYISRLYAVQRDLDHIVGPGATPPLDIFPILQYIPERWASWKTMARSIRNVHRALWHELLGVIEKRIIQDRRQGSFMEEVWDKKEHYGFDREKMAYVGSNLMEAGSDTTAVYLQSFISLITAFPDVQERAQKEIDEVIGTSRSPSFADWDSLPYLQAIVKEIHRFRPLAPQLIPHSTTADEHIGQYILPKGSMIFVNIWGINHDPEAFDHPEEFNPERFLHSDLGAREGADCTGRRNDMVFGSGRRLCPGMEFANNSIKINTMNMLWAFNFHLAKDATGQPIPIDLNDTTDGILLTQKPFRCVIEPRSPRHAEIIRDNYAAARERLMNFENELSESERTYVAECFANHLSCDVRLQSNMICMYEHRLGYTDAWRARAQMNNSSDPAIFRPPTWRDLSVQLNNYVGHTVNVRYGEHVVQRYVADALESLMKGKTFVLQERDTVGNTLSEQNVPADDFAEMIVRV